MTWRTAVTIAVAGVMALLTMCPAGAKSGSLVTAEMRARATANCERYDWAANYRDRLVLAVEPWMGLSDEELWRLLPGQEMPRDAAVNRGDGCPKCGMDHYQAPYQPSRWHVDFAERPWQVQCRNCEQWFPANDFASYYASALDAQHKFHQGAGDPRFLQPAEGLPAAWVDDGTGAQVDGKKWFFAAFYAFNIWEQMLNFVGKAAALYSITGDPIYAHKAGVVLDRMADLYPEMDFAPHFALGMEASSGGSGRGGVQGRIWEAFTAESVSLAYDLVNDALLQDSELVAFSTRMSERYGTGDKSSSQVIARHIEDHLLRVFIQSVHADRIRGNPGSHQYAMACAAIALDDPVETEEALDWLFEPRGGAIPLIMHQRLGREGFSDEAALGYAWVPARSFYKLAGLLRHYPRYDKHDIIRDYPKFRACYTMGANARMLDSYSPNWGDGDKCMNFGGMSMAIEPDMALQGYRILGGVEIAREVWFANRKNLGGLLIIRPSKEPLPEDIHFHLYEDSPGDVLADLERDLAVDPGPLRSYNAGGHGQAFLQAPSREHGRALALYYGRMAGHGHPDRLNYVLVAQDVVMVADMGYPLYTGANWKKRFGWTDHTISHNTCMVNDRVMSTGSWSGKTRLFVADGAMRVADVDGGDVYEGVTTYRRCMVMVDVDEANSYVLDLFWVRGGRNHRLIQNGGGPEVTHRGLQLVAQPTGTYAGPDIAYGQEYDGQQTTGYTGSGFSYLVRVERSGPADSFMVDWAIVDPRRTMPEGWDGHLRLHSLTQVDEVALADGVPPEFKGNPPRLRYLLRTRYGEGLSTQFVTVLEPYGNQPFIASTRLLNAAEVNGRFTAAVEVALVDGRRDVLLVSEEPGEVSAGDVTMDGRIALARYRGDQVIAQGLIQGHSLHASGNAHELPRAAVTGTLEGWDDSDPDRVLLKLSDDLPQADLVGRYIIFANSERSDASYRIEEVVDARTVSIGRKSLIERMADPTDYEKGLIYNVAKGDAFTIAMSCWAELPQ